MQMGLSFGEVLGDLLSEKNMSQKQLAEALSIPSSTLSNYFQNTREPNFATLKRLADYFGVTADYLLDHRAGPAASHQEDEFLRILRSLDKDRRELFLQIGKLLLAQTDASGNG